LRIPGPVISALVHAGLLALVAMMVKTEGRIATPIMAFISGESPKPAEPQKPPEPAKKAEPPKPAPRAQAPRAAPTSPAAQAAQPQAWAGAKPLLDLGMVLDAEADGVPEGAVVLPAGMVAAVGTGGRAQTAATPAAAVVRPRRPECEEEVEDPVVERRSQFEYPPGLPGVAGRLVVKVFVSSAGEVVRAEVVSSVHPDVDRAAVESFRRWRFRPALRCGKPVAGTFTVAANFELSDG
jgi:periplasmic protein TonB